MKDNINQVYFQLINAIGVWYPSTQILIDVTLDVLRQQLRPDDLVNKGSVHRFVYIFFIQH
jgi:hypothetical protein